MPQFSRRAFTKMAACIAVIPAGSAYSPAMARAVEAMRDNLIALDAAQMRWSRDRCAYERAGLYEQDAFWSWYKSQPSTLAYEDAVANARDAVERVFLTPQSFRDDEDAVLEALHAYEEIHPSSFWMQTARDLFTPRRHRTYSQDHIRHWLLTDPEEDFEKTGMPGFLKVMRTRLGAS